MANVLLIRTCHDKNDASYYSYQWAETIKQAFLKQNINLQELAKNDAIQSQVINALADSEIKLIIFYGHGDEDCFIGQDEKPLIDLTNLAILTGKQVYVVACYTAKQLGKQAAGIVDWYLGYDNEVILWTNYADYVGLCVNKGSLTMLENSTITIEQARIAIIAEYNRWIDYFAMGEGNNFEFAADLRHNRDALAPVFGNKTAVLKSR